MCRGQRKTELSLEAGRGKSIQEFNLESLEVWAKFTSEHESDNFPVVPPHKCVSVCFSLAQQSVPNT